MHCILTLQMKAKQSQMRKEWIILRLPHRRQNRSAVISHKPYSKITPTCMGKQESVAYTLQGTHDQAYRDEMHTLWHLARVAR